MSEETLAAVIRTLQRATDELSASHVAEDVGISRVTARRYLEHLAEQRLASRSPPLRRRWPARVPLRLGHVARLASAVEGLRTLVRHERRKRGRSVGDLVDAVLRGR
jgi:DNA-binding IclR family transcriptional regulator